MHWKSHTKSAFLLILSALAILGIARFCHHATRGFRLSKIRSTCSWESPPPQKRDLTSPHCLLQQKFHFLGRGLQCFVFESEDKKYVLKLFNNRYQRKIALFSLLSHCPFLGEWADAKKHYFEGKLLKTFRSYQIAFEEMQDRTALVYSHLYPTSHLPLKLTLIDPLNIHHEIDPNTVGFLIQKRATLIYPTLKDCIDRQDIEGAKRTLSSLVELFFWKWKHSIADNDPLIRTNYGILEGKAIQIDVGPLSKDPSPPTLKQRQEQIAKITTSLTCWLRENAPELIPFLEQELLQQLSSEG
jgi:hypothetical protein